ncbi:MAG: 2-phospho-L-lactate transferase CofD family protein, partial [Anaerolineales bacterium]
RLRAGETLTSVTGALCAALNIGAPVLPMTDDRLRTLVDSDEGRLAFQEYFVHRQCRPRVSGFVFEGAARATPAVLGALEQADLIVICPSNPFVSIGPILALPGVRDVLAARPVAAVTPIVGGQAIKGPAAKMLAELGLEVSAVAVARYYQGLLDYFVMDQVDDGLAGELAGGGLKVTVTDTIMRTDADRARLAQVVLEMAGAG